MIFKRKKYKLPVFPPNSSRFFLQSCKVVDLDQINSFKDEIEEYFTSIKDKSLKNKLLDIKTGTKIYDACIFLMNNYSEFDEHSKSLIVGGIQYFLNFNQGINDEKFASGFNDDAQIINFVLEELGIEELFIEI